MNKTKYKRKCLMGALSMILRQDMYLSYIKWRCFGFTHTYMHAEESMKLNGLTMKITSKGLIINININGSRDK